MGDPIIIWLPGTVFDYTEACQQYLNFSRYYACDTEGGGDEGVYVTCCLAGG
jgi:hypothetical protein